MYSQTGIGYKLVAFQFKFAPAFKHPNWTKREISYALSVAIVESKVIVVLNKRMFENRQKMVIGNS